MFLTVLSLVASLSRPARAACPADGATLRAEVDAALAAYEAWEWRRFESETAAVWRDLSCASERLPPELARDLHVLSALVAFRVDDADGMEAAFRGVLAVDPGWAPTIDQAAPGSTIHAAWERARQHDVRRGWLLLPGDSWIVDGREPGEGVRLGRCAVVQWSDGDGGWETWYVDHGGVPGTLLARVASEGETGLPSGSVARRLPATAPGRARDGRRARWLVAGAVGSGLASAGSLWLAAHQRQVFEEAATDEEASRAFRANYFWGFTGYTLGALGAGMAVGVLLERAW